MPITSEELEKRFTYHAPHGDQTDRYQTIRAYALSFAQVIIKLTPSSREQSLAITALEDCVMRANQAIAVNESQVQPATDPNTLYPDVLTTEHQAEPSSPASSPKLEAYVDPSDIHKHDIGIPGYEVQSQNTVLRLRQAGEDQAE